MFNSRISRIVILLLMIVALLAGCRDDHNSTNQTEPSNHTLSNPATESSGQESEPASEPAASEELDYRILVTNKAGVPLINIRVKVYPDSTLLNLEGMGRTDESGLFTIKAETSDSYVAVLQDVPSGYAVEPYYSLVDQETIIQLDSITLTDEMLNDKKFKISLGSPMPDFILQGLDGKDVMLSDLLAEKKAVVLNFWDTGCTPCKMEFPYLQEAYDQFADDIAVIALDPFDDNSVIEAFRQEHGYTFSMTSCDPRLESMLSASVHPTTVVIDRYGIITMIHAGAVPNAQPFVDMFGFYGADDYSHTVLEDLEQLPEYISD